jgi:hypothetical protein
MSSESARRSGYFEYPRHQSRWNKYQSVIHTTIISLTSNMSTTAAAPTVTAENGLVIHHLEDSRSQRVLWMLVRFCPALQSIY